MVATGWSTSRSSSPMTKCGSDSTNTLRRNSSAGPTPRPRTSILNDSFHEAPMPRRRRLCLIAPKAGFHGHTDPSTGTSGKSAAAAHPPPAPAPPAWSAARGGQRRELLARAVERLRGLRRSEPAALPAREPTGRRWSGARWRRCSPRARTRSRSSGRSSKSLEAPHTATAASRTHAPSPCASPHRHGTTRTRLRDPGRVSRTMSRNAARRSAAIRWRSLRPSRPSASSQRRTPARSTTTANDSLKSVSPGA